MGNKTELDSQVKQHENTFTWLPLSWKKKHLENETFSRSGIIRKFSVCKGLEKSGPGNSTKLMVMSVFGKYTYSVQER